VILECPFIHTHNRPTDYNLYTHRTDQLSRELISTHHCNKQNTHTSQSDAVQLNQQFYELLKILKFLELKIPTCSHTASKDDSATILARVYTPDDSQKRPKYVVIQYMKDKNKCRI
jgi:hypothetical protein